jgi:hypothetical protein
VTLLFGPQVSLTVLTTLGFAGSAGAMYYLLRRWRVSVGAAALAGALYGFSPALLHSALGHYNLQFAVLPPLIIDAGLAIAAGRPDGARGTYRLELRRKPESADGSSPGPRGSRGWSPASLRSHGTACGWAFCWRHSLFISEELALLTAITGVLPVIGLAVSRRWPRCAERGFRSAATLCTSAVVTFSISGHALWTQFAGRLVQHGALFPPDYYVNDPANFVTPSSYLLFHTAGTATTAAKYQGGSTEYLAFLGWQLIIVLALAAVVS